MSDQQPDADFAAWMAFDSVSEFSNNVRIPWQGKRALHLLISARGCSFGEALLHLVEQGTIVPVVSYAAIVNLSRYYALVEEFETSAPKAP